MWTKLHWIDGPWSGKLAIAARPRGGDWLEDEIARWRRSGIDSVISLLTPEEGSDLDIANEKLVAERHGINFFSFPIRDRDVPVSETEFARALGDVEAELSSGRNVALHCRQGVGRSGLAAACLLLTRGIDVESALRRIAAARGETVPETAEQRRWIDRYAETLAGASRG